MSADERDERLEELTSAWRPTSIMGGPEAHPAWHDLTAEDREETFRQTSLQRAMEAALDRDRMSTTARAVMARIRGA